MPRNPSLSALALMLILAGCAAQAPAPTPQQPAPEVRSPVTAPEVPHDTQGWIPDPLNPSNGGKVQNVNLPYAGDLDHPVVVIQDGRFQPYYTHVRLGGTVTWINRERTTQTVSSPVPGGATQEGFWEGSMPPGQSYTKTFSRFVGTFTFYTKENPDLHGNIIVVGKPR